MSHRKRAVKPLIARRAFFLPPLVRLHCTARIPACDSAYLEFYRITVRFFTDIAFVSHFSTYTECTPVRFLFVLLSRSAGFICALFARFQRKFSVNHTKSAYFQRKSRKVSVNLTGNARPSMEKHGGRAPHIFSQHIESI